MKYHENSEKNQAVEIFVKEEGLNPTMVKCSISEALMIKEIKEDSFFISCCFPRKERKKECFGKRKQSLIDFLNKILFS